MTDTSNRGYYIPEQVRNSLCDINYSPRQKAALARLHAGEGITYISEETVIWLVDQRLAVYDSTSTLILTSTGIIAYEVTHPASTAFSRRYRVTAV